MAKIEKNCWTNRNILEKFLVIIILLLMTLTVALIAILLLQKGSSTETTTCLTPDCVKASALILDFIDTSVDPCENFYDFACGNYMKSSLETKAASPMKLLDKITENRLRSLITEPTNESLPLPLEQQRRFYQSCLNTTAIDETYKATLLGLITELGGWPVLKPRTWDERRFDWITATIKCRELGFYFRHFLGIIGKDDNDSGLFLLSIHRPLINVVEEQHKEAYVEAMAGIAVDLGANVYQATTEFRRVLHFQEQLVKLVEESEKVDKELKVTIAELTQRSPGIPWLKLLKGLTRNLAVVNENTSVTAFVENFGKNLTALFARTSKSTQANYMIWRTIEYYYKILGTNIMNCYSKFLVVSDEDYQRSEDRSQYCLKKARQYFPFVAEVAYVRKYTPPQLKKNVEEMVENIRRQIINRMKGGDWMDEATKREAESRLKRIESYTGWSETVFKEDFAKLVNLEGFTFPSGNFLEIVLKLSMKENDKVFQDINKNYSELTKSVLRNSPILNVNAYYAPQLEILILPSSVMQGQFYDNNRPQYMNYGALGSVIGHEFTHGLGTSNDLPTNEVEWWSPETQENFTKKSQCLVQQYDNYAHHLRGFTKNGTQALDENFADLLGPSLAYQAYQEWRTKHGDEQLLPGVNYTANQIFWIMFGSFKCFQPKMGYSGNILALSHHGVPSFGVIASTRNSRDFASDFGCSPNSEMNPKEKCEIL